jgi:hypothetical protein
MSDQQHPKGTPEREGEAHVTWRRYGEDGQGRANLRLRYTLEDERTVWRTLWLHTPAARGFSFKWLACHGLEVTETDYQSGLLARYDWQRIHLGPVRVKLLEREWQGRTNLDIAPFPVAVPESNQDRQFRDTAPITRSPAPSPSPSPSSSSAWDDVPF